MVTKVFEDNAFIRFKTTFAEAKNVGDAPTAEIHNRGFITLSSSEGYCQVTNSMIDINFGQDYKAELIDCCGSVLADITDRFFTFRIVTEETGIENFYWEVINLPPLYGKAVHIKLSHFADGKPISNLVVYSNAFNISPEIKDTTRIDYRLPNQEFYQSIRIKAAYQQPTDNTELQTYQQSQSGNTVFKTAPVSLSREYIVEYFNNIGFKSFANFRAMVGEKYFTNADELYGVRVTTITSNRETRAGNSNFYKGALTVYVDETERFTQVYQIKNPFQLINKSPLGKINIGVISFVLKGTFSEIPYLGSGFLNIHSENGDIVSTFTESDITITDNRFEIIVPNTFVLGKYYVTITSGLFLSLLGETIEITDPLEWTFEFAVGKYDGTKYSDKYFIN